MQWEMKEIVRTRMEMETHLIAKRGRGERKWEWEVGANAAEVRENQLE
jgi:hypothetical protein